MRGKAELILRFLRGNKHFFVLAIIFSMADTMLNSMIPQVVRLTVDYILGDKSLPVFFRQSASAGTALAMAAVTVVVIAALNMGCSYLARTFTAKGSEYFVKDFRDALFGHIQRLPFEWHTKHQTGEIIQRCTSDVESVKNFITNQLLEVFRICFLIVFSVSLMFSMSVKITMIALILIPITLMYSIFFYGKVGKKFQDADEAEGRLMTQAQRNLTGVRVVKAFGRENYETERFQEKNVEVADMWIKLDLVKCLYGGAADVLTGLQVILIITVGTIAAVNGEVTLGAFLAIVSYNMALIWPVRGLGRVLVEMSKAGVSIDRLAYILDSEEEKDAEDVCTPPMDRDIHFEHVTFGYDKSEPVLKDLSFTIEAGKTFAILGATGSGKSTLVHLLNGLYELSEEDGTIRISDTDIRKISKAYLRKHIGIVLQEPFLYSGTIKENVGITLEYPSMEDIKKACETACVDGAIEGFADGYDTMVGERGVTLSGGQKQRVAIARMLMQSADIMVFDDAMSAVDTETDIKIRTALKEQMNAATVILISHRITTLMQADKIMVLADGRITEMGSHEELMALGGTYRKIHDIQMEGQKEGENWYEKRKKYGSSFDLKIWKRLIPFFKPFYWIFGWTLFADLVCALTDLLMPLFQKYAVDEFIEKGTVDGIWKFAAGYGIMLVIRSLSVIMFSRGSTKIEMNLARDMRLACFKHLQTLSLSYYNVTPVGHILSRMMSDTRRISALIAWNLTYILWVVPYVISVMVTMAFLNFKLAVWVVLIVPFLVFLTKFFKKRILHWNREIRAQNSKITSAYNEGIMGAKTSKTLGIEEKNTKDFEKVTAEMRASGIRAERVRAVYVSGITLFGAVITAIVLNYGGQMVLEEALEIGTLSAFTAYAVSLFDPLQQMAGNLSELISAQANIERVMELLDEVPQITDTKEVMEKYGDVFYPKKENFEPIRGDVEFENVSFRYPDGKEDVLTDFNLKVPAGTTVAIVGETGAGKSTIVDLVCRFFEPTKGRILVDGRDYRERSQLWLHSHIGYVLQNPHLFSGSVLENIRYGNLDATDEEVKAAAKCVSADQVVRHLEHGWDSDVGEGGDALSTGEKQLVSFARAVLANPAIFILDEATASIDTETEQLIQGAVEYLLKDRTSFIIAHRLSTIRRADVILVVQDGEIIEQGTHEELMENREHYYELYTHQFRKELEKEIV